MKAVVYSGTRGIYYDMIPSINSALRNGNIDKVYVLAEDDTFPHKEVEVIKVSNPFEGSPNIKKWTWMVLMKAYLSKLIPLDKVLYLDYDTLVLGDLSPLWELDMTDYYYGGVREPLKSKGGAWYQRDLYINAGVLLCNLNKLRDGKDDEIIKALMTKDYPYCEQDCINELCEGNILTLQGRYNRNDYTETDTETIIRHYATLPQEVWGRLEEVRRYEDR